MDRFGLRQRLVVGPVIHPAVSNLDLPFGHGGNLLVVCDHDNRPSLRVKLPEQVKHAGLVFGVQFAGRLVGEDDARVVRQRTGDGHALPLAPGQA